MGGGLGIAAHAKSCPQLCSSLTCSIAQLVIRLRGGHETVCYQALAVAIETSACNWNLIPTQRRPRLQSASSFAVNVACTLKGNRKKVSLQFARRISQWATHKTTAINYTFHFVCTTM